MIQVRTFGCCVLHSDCIKIYDEVIFLQNAHCRGPHHILMPGKGTILSFKQVFMGRLFFSVSSVSFQALIISLHLLIITLFQEDNIFGMNAYQTYGPQIQRHTCV